MSFNSIHESNLSISEVAPANNSLGQHDFLQLMLAQNQEQRNSEFLLQLSRFSSNNVGTKMQESLEQMPTTLQSNQALQASALVGRKVLIRSDILELIRKGNVQAAVEIPPGCKKLLALIYSESAQLIKTICVPDPKPGFFQFIWDGTNEDDIRAEEGYYKITAHAAYEGKEVPLNTLTFRNVDSVSLSQSGDGLKLNAAGIGPVFLDEVRQILV